MLQNLKATAKNSFIYGIGNFTIKLVGLLLIPIYTNTQYLSLDDYGALGILEAASQILVALAAIAMPQALTRWYWDKKYIDKQKSIFFTVFSFLLVLIILICLFLFPFSRTLSLLLFHHDHYALLIKMMLVSSGLQVLVTIVLTLMKLQEKSGYYSLSSIFRLTAILLITIYLIVYRGKGLYGIYAAQILGSVAFFILLTPYIIKNIRFRFEKPVLVEMLQYGYPLVLGSMSGILLTTFDRFTLNFLGNLPDVGVYSLGYKISNTIKILIVTSLQLAVSPQIFKMMDQPDNKRFYSRIMTYFSFVVLFSVMGISFFAQEIIKVITVDTRYWRAIGIIPILSMAIFFGMLKDTALIGLQITKKTKIIGTVISLIALLNLGLNVLLIPEFSIFGAAWATLFSQIIFFGIILFFAQKHYPIPYEYRRIIKMVILAVCMYGVVVIINDTALWIRLVVKTTLLAAFPFILYLIGFFEKVELKSLKGFWLKWKVVNNWKNNILDIFGQ